MSKFTLWRAEARRNLALALPLIAAQLSFVGMGTADTLFAGRLGSGALAAVAVGTAVWFMLFVIYNGLFMAVSPIVAQRRGAGLPMSETGDFLRGTLVLAVLCGLSWTALFLALRQPLLRLLGLDPEVSAAASEFLFAIAWSGLPQCLSFALRNAAEGMGLTRAPMLAGLAALGANILGDWLLMFGHYGLPNLGAAGAGWASFGASWFMLGAYLYMYGRIPQLRALKLLRRGVVPLRAASAEVIRLGAPIGIIIFAEAALFNVGALMMARLGEVQMAAHQVALNFASLAFMVPLGIAMATTVRVGEAAGAGDLQAAALRGRIGIALGALYALLSATVMASMPGVIVAAYTDVPDVAAFATHLLGYAALFQLFDCVQSTSNGALRGIKDTRVPMLVTLAAYWLLGLPVAIWLAFGTTVGGAGIWWGFIVGLGVAALGLSARFVVKMRKLQRVKHEGSVLMP